MTMIAARTFRAVKWSSIFALAVAVLCSSVVVTRQLWYKPSDGDAPASNTEAMPADTPKPTTEILIQYKGLVPEMEKQKIRDQASVVLVREIETSYAHMDVVKPKSESDASVKKAIQEISRNPSVQFVEMQAAYRHEPNPQ